MEETQEDGDNWKKEGGAIKEKEEKVDNESTD